MIQNIVSIDFVFQPTFCWVDGWLLVFKEPGQEVAVVAAVWSLESAAELPILILCVTKPTGKRLNIKPPLKSPKLFGYQHPPSPHMQLLFVHNFHSINKLYCDYFYIFRLIVLRTCCGTAGRAARPRSCRVCRWRSWSPSWTPSSRSRPTAAASPSPSHPPPSPSGSQTPAPLTRSGCGLDSTAFSSSALVHQH